MRNFKNLQCLLIGGVGGVGGVPAHDDGPRYAAGLDGALGVVPRPDAGGCVKSPERMCGSSAMASDVYLHTCTTVAFVSCLVCLGGWGWKITVERWGWGV